MDHHEIHTWLEANYRKIEPAWKAAPRLLGANATRVAEQAQFLALGQGLVSRLEKAVQQADPTQHKPMHFAILRTAEDERNAWVCWPAKFDGILVTQGLIEQMQWVCSEVETVVGQAMAGPPGSDNPLRRLWAGLPAGTTSFASYGGLLAQVAFGFIVHHELAHAGLGHEWIIRQRSADQSMPLGPSDEHPPPGGGGGSILHEAPDGSAASAHGGEQAWRQPLEADADLNGLRYTVQFIEQQANRFRALDVPPDDTMGTVWKHVLTDDWRRWFTTMAGVSIGLGCLLSAAAARLGPLDGASHPPLPARMLVLLHAARQLQPQAQQVSAAEVLLLVATLFGRRGRAEGQASQTLASALGRFDLQEAVARFDTIGQHFEGLAAQMRRLDASRDHLRRFPDFLRWAWYARGPA